MRGVRRTAQRIDREPDSVTEIDGVENGGEHKDIGLGFGDSDNQAVDVTLAQRAIRSKVSSLRGAARSEPAAEQPKG